MALSRYNEREKMKRLILERGQLFGEDECLLMVLNNGKIEGKLKPADTYWTVTCSSSHGELLMADLPDIWKMIKGERTAINFMKEQYCVKFPDQDILDTHQEQVHRSHVDVPEKSKSAFATVDQGLQPVVRR